MAERRGLGRFRCEAPPYSLLVRGIERSVLPICQRFGMGVVVWFPLAGGWLDRDGGPPRVQASAPGYQERMSRVSALAALAREKGLELAELSMAFTVAHPAVTSAIIEVHTVDELRHRLRGAALELDDATLDRLDEIVEPGRDIVSKDAGWDPPDIANAAATTSPSR